MSFVLFLIVLFWVYRVSEASGCVLPATPARTKTRIFDSVEQYRANKVSFKPTVTGWQGSNVEFSFNISILPKNGFATFDSDSIIVLKLSGKQIKQIEDGAFMSLSCLEELFLDHNNLTKVSRNIFPNRLKKLDLSHNQIEMLQNSTFANLFRLKELNLGNNRIKSLEVLVFVNLTFLEYLNLEYNQIKKMPDFLFRPLPNLLNLILSWNKFDLEAEKWGNLSKLENLQVAGIGLDHFDPIRIPFTNLKGVNLSFNFLTILNVTRLKRHFPNLESVDLGNNSWNCEDLKDISRKLKGLNIKVASSANFSQCGESLKISTTMKSVKTTTSAKISGGYVERDHLERYVENMIKKNNEELGSTIASVRTFAIVTFSLLWIFIILEVLYRSNVCGIFSNRTRRRNEESVEENNEDFRLLHMKES